MKPPRVQIMTRNNNRSLSNMPRNMLEEILGKLNGKELARMRAVSKQYREYINSRRNLLNKIRNAERVAIGIKLIRKHNNAVANWRRAHRAQLGFHMIPNNHLTQAQRKALNAFYNANNKLRAIKREITRHFNQNFNQTLARPVRNHNRHRAGQFAIHHGL